VVAINTSGSFFFFIGIGIVCAFKLTAKVVQKEEEEEYLDSRISMRPINISILYIVVVTKSREFLNRQTNTTDFGSLKFLSHHFGTLPLLCAHESMKGVIKNLKNNFFLAVNSEMTTSESSSSRNVCLECLGFTKVDEWIRLLIS